MIQVIEADLTLPAHADMVVRLTDMYARDEMAGGDGLRPEVAATLTSALLAHPARFQFIAIDEGGNGVGIATCFMGFSTFNAAPLLNIHDLAAVPEVRGQGVASALIRAVEEKAAELGCCKVTLEVKVANEHARKVYGHLGFTETEVTNTATLFCSKPITP